MYKHILIATDGSQLAQKALSHGLALAKVLNASATAVTVTEPWSIYLIGEEENTLRNPIKEYEENAAAAASRILSGVAETANKLGVSCATVHAKDQYPAEGIIATAKDKGCDLIVMASHGRRGLAKLLLGSQATRVLAFSTIPVLICR
jgi:nucleotide-binding universal stress UspA family protein